MTKREFIMIFFSLDMATLGLSEIKTNYGYHPFSSETSISYIKNVSMLHRK